MKHTSSMLALLVSIFFVVPVMAENVPTKEEHCATAYRLAQLIMDARQINMPLPDTLAIVADSPKPVAMVQEAYRQPRYLSNEFQTNASIDFANKHYTRCLDEY